MSTPKPETTNKSSAIGLSAGLAAGAGLGVTLWLATGQFIFFPIFVGAGISVGVAIDAAKNQAEATDIEKAA